MGPLAFSSFNYEKQMTIAFILTLIALPLAFFAGVCVGLAMDFESLFEIILDFFNELLEAIVDEDDED